MHVSFYKLGLLYLTGLLFMGPSHAQEQKIYHFVYTTQKETSLSQIYQRLLKPKAQINSETIYVRKTVYENQHVKDWNAIAPETRIQLYVSSKDLDWFKFAQEMGLIKSYTLPKLLERNEAEAYSPFGLSIFYMASKGSFSQESQEKVSIDFEQNSPVTLGVMGSYNPKSLPFTWFSSSLYVSSLNGGQNPAVEKIEVPPEVGINVYANRKLRQWEVTVYGGLDYETFHTFNSQLIIEKKRI